MSFDVIIVGRLDLRTLVQGYLLSICAKFSFAASSCKYMYFVKAKICVTRPSLISLALSTGTGQKLDLTEVAAELKTVGTGLLGLGKVRLVLEAVVLDSAAAEVDLVIRKADLVDSLKKGLLTTGASKSSLLYSSS
ncbi:hypothetical protein G6F24_006862 [Rhizopus arrhizus]|nr:hypothetical protein G6F24_006862 [Rhizopus arrhizus]